MYVSMYACIVITSSRVWIDRVRLLILLVVSGTGKMNILLSPYVPESLIPRDGFSRPVLRQPAHLQTQAESGAYSRNPSRFPRRRWKKKYAKKRAPSPASLEILRASDSELRPRRSSGVRLAYRDASGKRQRAPSTPQWGLSSLQTSLRRAIASSVHTCFQESKHSFFKNKNKKAGGFELTARELSNVPIGPLRHGASATCCNALLTFCI